MFPWDKNWWRRQTVLFNNVLIPWYPISNLTIASSGFFGGGRLRVPTRRCAVLGPADWGARHGKYTLKRTVVVWLHSHTTSPVTAASGSSWKSAGSLLDSFQISLAS
jgi:hypothetical protein